MELANSYAPPRQDDFFDPAGGVRLDSVDIIRGLNELDPGFHADFGTRHNLWHPNQSVHQGLYHYHRHICAMDRGSSPQWPVWNSEDGYVSVPLDYALLHDDLPIVDIDPLKGKESMSEGSMARVKMRKLNDVRMVGWAEVFYRIIMAKIPGIDARALAVKFKVPMDWASNMKESPVGASIREASMRGWI